VNIVAPGLVATEMGERMTRALQGVEKVTDLDADSPFGRVCRPEDVAAVVTFLVGPAATYVTGQRIAVDGGAERGNRVARNPGATLSADTKPTHRATIVGGGNI
jgi:3-oxoacyl-[acyl-carrier protein] reductase